MEPFPTFNSHKKNREILDLTHSDVCGKVTPTSIGGAKLQLIALELFKIVDGK